MLNAEKYKNEILETLDCDCEGFGVTEDNKITMCRANNYCNFCLFLKDGFCSSEAKDRWLLSEYKEPIKLSRLEHELLKFINNEGYKYIARDNCGEVLFRYPEKPTKNIYGEWVKGGICSDLRMFNDLFQFVKWEDSTPTSIKDVLNNCEVVDSDL